MENHERVTMWTRKNPQLVAMLLVVAGTLLGAWMAHERYIESLRRHNVIRWDCGRCLLNEDGEKVYALGCVPYVRKE